MDDHSAFLGIRELNLKIYSNVYSILLSQKRFNLNSNHIFMNKYKSTLSKDLS
jgi:hypothetical protein